MVKFFIMIEDKDSMLQKTKHSWCGNTCIVFFIFCWHMYTVFIYKCKEEVQA